MMVEIKIKNEIKSFTVKKQGPIFLFAYDENGNQCGYAKTVPELIVKIENDFDKHNEWNALSAQEKSIRNAYAAFSFGHMS